MADFDDIRRGLAANLAALKDEFQVSLYLLDNPTAPVLQIAGLKEAEYDITFRDGGGYDATGDRLTVQIEAALPLSVDVAGQKLLDRLHAADGLKNAVEADDRLTSRMADDKTVTAGHDPACDQLRVTVYNGPAAHTLNNGTKVLLATWDVEILT